MTTVITQLPSPAAKSLGLRLLIVACAIIAAAAILKLTGALEYLTFTALARNREWLVTEVAALGIAAPILFVLAYAAAAPSSAHVSRTKPSRSPASRQALIRRSNA